MFNQRCCFLQHVSDKHGDFCDLSSANTLLRPIINSSSDTKTIAMMEENNCLLAELLQNLHTKHAIRGWLKVLHIARKIIFNSANKDTILTNLLTL